MRVVLKTMAWLFLFSSITFVIFGDQIRRGLHLPTHWQEVRFGGHGRFLEGADEVKLYSLSPDYFPYHSGPFVGAFGGFPIYDEIILKQEGVTQIQKELKRCIYSSSGYAVSLCFWPRHGLRASKDGEVRDYLICFQCRQIRIQGNRAEESEFISLESSMAARFMNELLDAQGIPREIPQ